MPADQVARHVVKLRRILAFIEEELVPPASPRTSLERLGRDALVRLRSQIRAVLAVASAPGIDGAEVEVLARPLLEAGITFGWVGTDDARARQVEHYATEQVSNLLREFVEVVNGRPLTGKFVRTSFPSLRRRAQDAGEWYASAYGMGYPRLSMATHGLAAAFQPFQPDQMATANALEDAVTGTKFILLWISKAFAWPDVEAFVARVQDDN
jgi:hypothetical protein